MSIKRTIVIGGTQGSKEKTVIPETKGGLAKEKAALTVKKAVKPTKKKIYRSFTNQDGKVLVIVESPAKSKTIEKFLGEKYVVKASMGHLRDLPKSRLGVNIEEGFVPTYANLPARKSLIDELRRQADESSAVLLATDPDREGEAISWHLAYILDLDEASPCRITFNEITKTAVSEALQKPRKIDMDMVDAQQARRILDRVVGYKLSPLLWRKVCKGLSAGRVQSVAVRLICEREREIQAFVPEEYWTLAGVYRTADKEEFMAELTACNGKKLGTLSGAQAEAIKKAIDGKKATVQAVETKKRSRKAPPPFTTSTLQQEGVRKLGYGAKRTMMIAQHLYEGMEIGGYGHVGLITYMRTDSVRIADEMAEQAKQYITTRYGKEYYPAKRNIYGSKESSQDAHEAIRPTSMELTPAMVKPYLSAEELKLYTLIWNRFIASQMAPQQAQIHTVTLEPEHGANEDAYTLRAVGSQVIFKGFTEVYEEDKGTDESKLIPAMQKGESVTNRKVEATQHFTQPPARYTEASLIKVLEEKGIGRPSTYAPILDTIMNRNYVEKQDRSFVPTELGFVVVDFLIAHFEKLINTDFTAQLEEELDEIAEGKDTYQNVLQTFYQYFSEELEEAGEAERVKIGEEESDEICDVCGKPMVYKFGRYGRFLACSNFPECTNTKPITVSTGITCPSCHEGEIVERKSRRGRVFYGCSAYPKCDFTMWDKPNGEICEVCGSLMVEKKYKNGNVKKYCSNEGCSTRPPKKTRKKKTEE